MSQFADTVRPFSPSLLGFTVSLITPAGAVPSVFTETLADWLGQLKMVCLEAMLFVVGAVMQGSAMELLLGGEGGGGLGEGVYQSASSV